MLKELVETYLHLCHDRMIGSVLEEGTVVSIGILIYILYLKTAFLEEPVLEAGNYLVHVSVVIDIEVEEVVGCYKIEVLEETNGACDVSTATDSGIVLTAKEFTMDIERLGFVVETKGVTVATVVVTSLYRRTEYRGVD